jgi:hypothetical protein
MTQSGLMPIRYLSNAAWWSLRDATPFGTDDRRLQEQNTEGPVIVLRQFLGLADRWLEVALPCLEPVGLDAEALGYAFGRVGASLLPDTPGPIAAAAGTNVRTEVAS